MKPIHEMIKEFREKKGWTQQEFAGKIGTSQSTINLWEKKKTKPKIENVPALASVMELPIETLIGLIIGENPEHPQYAVLENPSIDYQSNARKIQPNIKELYRELPFASLKAQAGIPESYEGCQLDWISETYPVYIRNHIASKKQLVIEIDGDSMTPDIKDGAHVLAEAVSKDNIKYESGGIYAVLFGNGRFVVKRIKTNTINTEGMLRLWSDNEQYGHIDIPANEIHCMWKVVGKVWEPMK